MPKQNRHSSDKIITDAIMRAVHRRQGPGKNDPKRLDVLADKLVAEGINGNIPAIKEIADRLEGKPKQQIDQNNTHDVSDNFKAVLQLMWAKSNESND